MTGRTVSHFHALFQHVEPQLGKNYTENTVLNAQINYILQYIHTVNSCFK